jgi:hypothetical protein
LRYVASKNVTPLNDIIAVEISWMRRALNIPKKWLLIDHPTA